MLPQDLLGILRILISKGWFQLDHYNKALKALKYSVQESSNKPQQVISSAKVKKLSGKATSQWVHIRVFPYIMYFNKWIKEADDPVFQLALKLHEITAFLTAESIRQHEVDTVEELIQSYLDERKVVYDEFPVLGRPKPKHHFLVHYPEAIKSFGPTGSFWTGRYESKHRVSKSTTESSKNFINITHTVCTRQQLRMCSTYYNGIFESNYLKLPTNVKRKVDLTNSEGDQKLKLFLSSPGDLICTEIEYKSRKYKVGDIVVIDRDDLITMDVGLVKSILVRRSEVFFIVKKYKAEMQSQLHLFICSATNNDFVTVSVKNLKDTYPLMKRGTEEKFVLIQHHHISFENA